MKLNFPFNFISFFQPKKYVSFYNLQHIFFLEFLKLTQFLFLNTFIGKEIIHRCPIKSKF